MSTNNETLAPPLALTLYTRQFAALVDAGIPLWQILQILSQEAPAPFEQISLAIQQRIGSGTILSEAMSERTDLFPAFYTNMVQMGEIGGVLEEAFSYLADWMEEAWRWWRLSGMPERWAWLLTPGGTGTPDDWSELDRHQRTFVLMLFCRALAMMHTAGVPMPILLEKAADLLPVRQREAVKEAARIEGESTIHDRLAGLTILPPLVSHLMAIGEQYGQFDRLLDKAADIYRHELMCEMVQA